MKLQKSLPLCDIYSREEDFSSDLANHLTALGVGSFEDAETESKVGTRTTVWNGLGSARPLSLSPCNHISLTTKGALNPNSPTFPL